MANEKLNRLFSGQGSVEERYRTVTTLSDEELQMAVPRSVEARVEWERRYSAETLSIARRALANSRRAIIVSVIAAIVAAITAIVAAIISRTPA
jgi:hypothetical protein